MCVCFVVCVCAGPGRGSSTDGVSGLYLQRGDMNAERGVKMDVQVIQPPGRSLHFKTEFIHQFDFKIKSDSFMQ